MAGVTADLELQTAQSLRAIDEVADALNRAVQIDLDAESLRRQIAAIEGVVVDIGADTTGLAEEVNAALGAADTSVDVDVEGDDLRRLTEQVEELGENAERTQDSITRVGGAIQRAFAVAGSFIAVRELTEFLTESVDAASNLSEQLSAGEVIFGDFADEASDAARTADVAMGLAEDQFLETNNAIGGLLVSMGLTRQEAARLGPEIIQRAADVASLRNIAGGTTEVLERFRSGLVGEAEALRPLGVVISETAVAQEGLRQGLGGATGELSEQEKVLARLQLIMDGTEIAAGNFADTSDGLANSQRILSAEWRNMQAAIGQELLPVALDLVGVAREELIPVIQELGVRGAPLLEQGLRSLAPAGRTALDLFEGFLPVLTLTADILDSLPDEVITLAASFGALRGIANPLNNTLGTTSGSIAGMNPAVFALTTGFTALTTIMGRNAERAAQHRRLIDQLADAFLNLDDTVRQDVAAQTAEQFAGLSDQLRTAGVSFDELTAAARRGGGEYEDIVLRILFANDELETGFSGTRAQLEGYAEQLQESAEAAINEAVATERLTEAQAEEAERRAGQVDGATNYLRALEILEPLLGDTAAAEKAAADAGADTAGAFSDVGSEADAATQEVDDFAAALDATLNPFLTSQEAALRYREEQRQLTEAIKEGRREGETRAAFEDRLRGSMLSTIDAAEAYTEAQLRNGEFTNGAADAADALVLRLLDLSNTFPALRPVIDEALKSLGDLDVEMEVQAERVGEGFGVGLARGIENGREVVRRAARNIAGEVVVVVRNGLQIESPSRVAREMGELFVEGFALGLSDTSAVEAAAMALASVPVTSVVPAFPTGAVTTTGLAGGAAGVGGARPFQAEAVFGNLVITQPTHPMHILAEAEMAYVEGTGVW